MAVSLVSYESSDEYSENESDCNSAGDSKETTEQYSTNIRLIDIKQDDKRNIKKVKIPTSSDKIIEFDATPVKESDSFPSLPKAKFHDADIDWNRLTILKSAHCGTVKISIPALAEMDEHDPEPEKKKLKPSQKGSGLFALLPIPKKQEKLIPHVVSSKINTKPVQILNNSSYFNSESKITNVHAVTDFLDYEDEDLLTDKGVDYFSLSKDTDNIATVNDSFNESPGPSGNLCEEKDSDMPICSSSFEPSTWSESTPTTLHKSFEQELSYPSSTSFISVQTNKLELNDIALQQLCGKRDRHKVQAADVELIEVDGDSIMPDSREWLTKQLTEENQYVIGQSHKKKDGPTSQQKRKHQITYLAYQAKEHELELKNQWANNRMSRKQTQAKYGF